MDGNTIHLMNGTFCNDCYAVIAKQGNVILGLKPLGFQDAPHPALKGRTYMAARLRIAHAPENFGKDDDGPGSVVNMADAKHYDLGDVFTDIPWMKKDDDGVPRYSTIWGSYLKGSLATDPKALLEKIETEDVIYRMAEQAVALVQDSAVVRVGTLAEWLHSMLDPALSQLKAQLEAVDKVHEQVEDLGEDFGFEQQKILSIHQEAADQAVGLQVGSDDDLPDEDNEEGHTAPN